MRTSAVIIERPSGAPNDEERYAYGADRQRVVSRSQRLVDGQREVTERVYLGAVERKRVWLGATLQLDRWTVHLEDGAGRAGVLHHWTVDTLGRETASVADIRLRYHVRAEAGSIAMTDRAAQRRRKRRRRSRSTSSSRFSEDRIIRSPKSPPGRAS